MRGRLLGLCLLSAVACADKEGLVENDPEANLPGDIENHPDGAALAASAAAASSESGTPDAAKADAWDSKNNPELLATKALNYRLFGNSQLGIKPLPDQGKLDKPVWRYRYPKLTAAPVAWSDTYWPTADRSHNKRWIGERELSPLEKYDKAFLGKAGCAMQPGALCGPGAKAAWDAYFRCAGPAATWQMRNYQDMGQMFDGKDNNNNGVKDGCPDEDTGEAPDSWWGTCHAWAPASLLEPEPQHEVWVNGVRFTVGDIKALIQSVYDSSQAVMLGGRSHAETVTRRTTTSANTSDQDVNPGALHVILTNFLGIYDQALVEDRTANQEVWNQPIVGYKVKKKARVTPAQANACVGAQGATWTYNKQAITLVEVEMEVEFVSETEPSRQPLGFRDFTDTDTYHYILELGKAGKIIGGRYCTESVADHPDFLWSPWAPAGAANPHINFADVTELIRRAVQ